MNSNVDPRRLRIGMTIVVPVGSRGGPSTTSAATRFASNASARGGVHTVSSGESFWTIARRYGISSAALATANAKSLGDLIHIGEQLRIP
jgi:LysM repeat protein